MSIPSITFLVIDFLLTSLVCSLTFLLGVAITKGKQDSHWYGAYKEVLDAYTDLVTKEVEV